MNGLFVTVKRELMSYAFSPVSWIIAVLFYLLRGFEVSSMVRAMAFFRRDPDQLFPATYGLSSTFLMVLLVPGLLSMRLFAEERRTGSIEILMTGPVRDLEIVIGKWLAAAIFYSLLWLPSGLVLFFMQGDSYLGTDLAFGPVLAAYLGMFLLSGMLLAFGCFASSLTDNVLLAAKLSMLFNTALMVAPGRIAQEIGELRFNYYVRELLSKTDVMNNFKEFFARGLIDSSQVVFYLGGIAFFLGLTWISIVTRRSV